MRISPTQITKYRRCQRLYAFEYVEGFKPPPSDKQQFGTDVHSELEQWLRDGRVPSNTPEGQTAKQGIKKGWLPTPDKGLFIEQEFAIDWDEDLEMIGFIDCVVPPDLADVPIVIDHKTTSSLNWCKTEEDLAKDEQAIIYSTVVAQQFKAQKVKARWIYYSASNPKSGRRKPNGARPVEVEFDVTSKSFLDLLKALLRDSKRIRRIRKRGIKGRALVPSPQSCEMFGGCPHKERCNLSGEDRLEAYMKRAERDE